MDVAIGVKETDLGWMGVASTGFTTDGWPTREIAIERIKQHRDEVRAGRDPRTGFPAAPMELLEEFRQRHGLVSDGERAILADGVELVEDDEDDEAGD